MQLFRWFRCPHRLPIRGRVPEDFFGINLAAHVDPVSDMQQVGWLHKLGIRQVRVDLRTDGLGGSQERLIRELLENDFRVLLGLVQVPSAVRDLTAWRRFLQERVRGNPVLANVEALEIGSVPNRRRWSGYRTVKSYAEAWRVAVEELDDWKPLVGPNVSDFEPLHSWRFLRRMHRPAARESHPSRQSTSARVAFWSRESTRLGSVCRCRPRTGPDWHSVNLFVERTREPEAYDVRVLGRWLSPGLKLNLVKKAGIFRRLSERYGADKTICSHTCWHGFRLRRWLEAEGFQGEELEIEIEQKRADYLVRYLALAATCGALDRVYWGPLVAHSEGLIDDGAGESEKENVAAFLESRGRVEDWNPRPAFNAMRQCAARMAGKDYEVIEDGVTADDSRFTIRFGEQHLTWTKDEGEQSTPMWI